MCNQIQKGDRCGVLMIDAICAGDEDSTDKLTSQEAFEKE